MTSEAGPISAEARRALEQELADLHAERNAVAATLGDTDSAGDTADQADELQRATQLDRVDARITEITVRLDGAAEAGPPRTDVVGPGSTVTVRFAAGAQETVHIGDVAEPLDQTLVTTDSPLGRALLGHRVGDSVSYEAPDGRTTVTVLSLGAP
ncbi:GreA/GreB family elongation factor [Streptomyces sp. RLB1-33]|nr:GreA/GreB family elongation factor [Streptomyces sp. RLB1-33]QIY75820.1 nucleoside diphosphate kinase regulator [Streptomyces sp. RLB1-33]